MEAKVAQDGIVLSEDQLAALERAKEEKVAHGQIETEHPGYLGSQDTFYVGDNQRRRSHLSADVRRYLLTSRFCQTLRPQKTRSSQPICLTIESFLSSKSKASRYCESFTDRGTEYCGNREHHEYQLYLAIEDIDHTKTKARSPQTNGICERFHKTILQEFYQIAFRKKIYQTIEALQADLDEWIVHYNQERPHSGRYCYGKTPTQTFQDSKQIAKEKMLDLTMQTVS